MYNFIKRFKKNPVLVRNRDNLWEAEAVFNCSPILSGKQIHLLYRALSTPQTVDGKEIRLSSIGCASSKDGLNFKERRQFIKPEREWEKYGCEDPRATFFEGKYYIFYTALGTFPFSAEGIKVGVATTKDFAKVEEKHLVTPFNAKAMSLFPERINGKIAIILTVNTDKPPAHIAIAYLNKKEEMFSMDFWDDWYKSFEKFSLPLKRSSIDHVEAGAPPLKTPHGWLLFYSYIQNYFSSSPLFTVEAALLDLKNPTKIIARAKEPLLIPEEEYEKNGMVPNVIFPSGAIIKGKDMLLYYGAADTSCALSIAPFSKLIREIKKEIFIRLERNKNNPILAPKTANDWESKAVFNPAAIYDGDKFHIIYRAMSEDNTSVFGYASSNDGFTIEERLPKPIYVPREEFELKRNPSANSGCEDPRLTVIGDTIYMCYTAYTGSGNPRVALTSISKKDFLKKNWIWEKPVLISPPNIDDKDAAVFPKKIKGKYAILHRLGAEIWLDYVDNLNFDGKTWIKGKIIISPRPGVRDSRKVGIAAPPIETKNGWLLLYHGISKREDNHYHVRAALLDKNDPSKVIARSRDPILETEMFYEKDGLVANVVFPCGAAVVNDILYVYYGAADKFVCAATTPVKELLKSLLAETKKK